MERTEGLVSQETFVPTLSEMEMPRFGALQIFLCCHFRICGE